MTQTVFTRILNNFRWLLLAVLVLLAPERFALAQKAALSDFIMSRGDSTWDMARRIWELAEPGYQETQSSKLLLEMLKDADFETQEGVAGMPTAFVAGYGKGRPVIAILGEFDALPGLSQKDIPWREQREETSYGHGCGHHLFGAASVAACLAIAEQIKAGHLKGTIRFYGCPAEEGGSGKVFMVRAGLFDDVDACLHWHPGDGNSAGDQTTLARMAVKFRFHGKASHASASPELGRSALDAVELTNHATQLLREHTPDFTRIHHVITSGGDAPNVVPEFAEVYYYVRHPDPETVAGLYTRLLRCARGAAIATETELEIAFQGGILNLLPNNTLAQVALANLAATNDLTYTPAELEFAARIQDTLSRPEPLRRIEEVANTTGGSSHGSTDVGDVSWVVPTTGFRTACWVPGTASHSWQATACGGTSIGKKGMLLAARVLAKTAWDLYSNPNIIEQAQAERKRRLNGKLYQSLMQERQTPPLDYRNPPSSTNRRPSTTAGNPSDTKAP